MSYACPITVSNVCDEAAGVDLTVEVQGLEAIGGVPVGRIDHLDLAVDRPARQRARSERAKPPSTSGSMNGPSKPPFWIRLVATRSVPCRNELKSPLLPVIRKPNVSPAWTGTAATPSYAKPLDGSVQQIAGPAFTSVWIVDRRRGARGVDEGLQADGDVEPGMQAFEGPREVGGPVQSGRGREASTLSAARRH